MPVGFGGREHCFRQKRKLAFDKILGRARETGYTLASQTVPTTSPNWPTNRSRRCRTKGMRLETVASEHPEQSRAGESARHLLLGLPWTVTHPHPASRHPQTGGHAARPPTQHAGGESGNVASASLPTSTSPRVHLTGQTRGQGRLGGTLSPPLPRRKAAESPSPLLAQRAEREAGAGQA